MRKPILSNKVPRFASRTFWALVTIAAIPAFGGVQAFAEADAGKNSAADDMTRKAIALFGENKFQDAVDLENQAVKSSPGYWLPHSVLSIFDWQRNVYDEALKEAQEAVKLAPDNELANLNFAQMNQMIGYYEKAVPAFRKAIKVAPKSWSARIGLSQSLIANSQPAEAFEVLNQMSKVESGDFNWWYNLSASLSQMNKPKEAADAAEKALAAATTNDQKSRANITLLVELIRASEIDRARAVQDEALKYKPKDDQVYVQVLSALCAPTEVARGKSLLNLATENGLSNSDGFYKLGGVFEKKANAEGIDSSTSGAWLELAEAAYREAIKSSPSEPRFYLALAAVLDRKGRTQEMVDVLSKAKSLDNSDELPSYLVSCVKAADNDLAGRLHEKLVGAPGKPYQLNLAKENFSVENLKCTCKLGALEFELKRQSGIKFAYITHREKPIKGTLLVDQSYGSGHAFKNVGKQQSVDLAVISTEPISTVSEAIKFVQNLRDTAPPVKTWSFEMDSPKMPLL